MKPTQPVVIEESEPEEEELPVRKVSRNKKSVSPQALRILRVYA